MGVLPLVLPQSLSLIAASGVGYVSQRSPVGDLVPNSVHCHGQLPQQTSAQFPISIVSFTTPFPAGPHPIESPHIWDDNGLLTCVVAAMVGLGLFVSHVMSAAFVERPRKHIW